MVHCFSMFGNNIVADVYSGAVHIMEAPAFALTKYYAQNGFEKDGLTQAATEACSEFPQPRLEEAYQELSQLEAEGALFSPDLYEKAAQNFRCV